MLCQCLASHLVFILRKQYIIVLTNGITIVIFIVIRQIIKDRVIKHPARPLFTWNTLPGSLVIMPEFSQTLDKFPFYWHQLGVGIDVNVNSSSSFTAVVYVTNTRPSSSADPLHRLMKVLASITTLHKVRYSAFDLAFLYRNI